MMGLLGGNQAYGGLLGQLSEEQQKALRSQQMMGLAQGLLSASGPSTNPANASLGHAFGLGLQGMQQAGENYTNDIYKMALIKKSLAPDQSDFDKLVSDYQSLPDTDPRKAFYKAKIDKETNADKKLSATQQKELYDTVDTLNSAQSALGNLKSAQSLLEGKNGQAKPFSGFAAETIAAMNRIPGVGLFVDDKRAASTTDYKNLVTSQALDNLKAIFGGMPTEGERALLLQLQALPSYDVEEQKRILTNATAAAEKRIKTNRQKAAAIESGDTSALYETPQQDVDPRVQKALQAGYTMEEIEQYMGGRR